MGGHYRGVSLKKGIFLLLPFLFSLSLQAQTSDSPAEDPLEKQFHIEVLKSQALDAMSRGDFELAISILDTAIVMTPDDVQLRDMRSALQEMRLVSSDEALKEDTSDTASPEFYDPQALEDQASAEEEAVEVPDFEEELFSGKQFEVPELYRDSLFAAVAAGYGMFKPIYLENDVFYQHTADEASHPAYTLFGDFQYYFEGVDRALGVGIRYYGNPLNPEDGEILKHQMDMAVQMRGFFQETTLTRSVLGFRFGVSLLLLDEYVRSRKQPALANALTFGVFYRDAVFRHLFRKSGFFRKLVFDLGVDYYYLTLTENSYMVRTMAAVSYEFAPHLYLGLSGRLLSTAQDIQVLSGWIGGVQLTYSF